MPNETGRLIAIGDIHGCVHSLEAVLMAIVPQATDQIVCLGDFVDQGRETREVIDLLLSLESQCHLVVLQGNHEEMMLAARENEQALRYWERCGGMMTLNSYRMGGSLKDIPANHWSFIERCRPWHETDEFLFSHANYDPKLPMSRQPGYALRWELLDPVEARPHIFGKPVIVGHTEQASGEILDRGFVKCIDTACWRYGWLTALDVQNGNCWQASRWGILRDPGESIQIGKLKPKLKGDDSENANIDPSLTLIAKSTFSGVRDN